MHWNGRLLDSRGIVRQASLCTEEAARRSPTGKQVACNGNPFSPFTKMLWMVLFFILAFI